MRDFEEALEQALLLVGGEKEWGRVARFCRRMQVTPQHFYQLKDAGSLSPRMALDIEHVTDGEVKALELYRRPVQVNPEQESATNR